MSTPTQIKIQINELIGYLVQVSLADAQYYAFQQSIRDNVEQVTFENARYVSLSLKDRSYNEIYEGLVRSRAYNVKMLDGALIQMMYEFADTGLKRHRLAFFPSPNLEEFQNHPDVYLEDEIYADIVARNIVPFPIRFDYDEDSTEELVHPKSHLTLGQYQNCRIPVTSPLSPFRFIDFILRNFYHTAYERYADGLPIHNNSFAESIQQSERRVIHVTVPT